MFCRDTRFLALRCTNTVYARTVSLRAEFLTSDCRPVPVLAPAELFLGPHAQLPYNVGKHTLARVAPRTSCTWTQTVHHRRYIHREALKKERNALHAAIHTASPPRNVPSAVGVDPVRADQDVLVRCLWLTPCTPTPPVYNSSESTAPPPLRCVFICWCARCSNFLPSSKQSPSRRVLLPVWVLLGCFRQKEHHIARRLYYYRHFRCDTQGTPREWRPPPVILVAGSIRGLHLWHAKLTTFFRGL